MYTKLGRPKGSKNKPKVTDSTPTTSTVINSTRKTAQKLDKVDKLLLNGKSNVKPSISTPSGKKTVKEVSDYLTKQEQVKEMFAATQTMIDALKLTDLSKTESRTFQTYSRDTLRTYLKSPKAYESQIRNLSRYLYRLCYEYRRICYFYATMICGDVFNIIPISDKDQTGEDLVDKWYETLTRWQRLDFKSELTKLLLVAWREDTVMDMYMMIQTKKVEHVSIKFLMVIIVEFLLLNKVYSGMLLIFLILDHIVLIWNTGTVNSNLNTKHMKKMPLFVGKN